MTRELQSGWLSLTPEPERELPCALATLRHGAPPPAVAVEAEARRLERLVVRARRRAYQRWLAEARGLAATDAADPRVRSAARLTTEILDNHDALALGLESRGGGTRR